MNVKFCKKRLDLSCFTYKAYGLACATFCIGLALGMFLPAQVVAVVEAVMLLFLAYLCLFVW